MDWEKLRNPEQREGYHRHSNADGTIGGWVSDDSIVAPTAYVGPNAEVTSSQINGNAQILGKAKVLSSTVQDNAVLKDRANASCCLIKDSAVLSGRTAAVGFLPSLRGPHASVIIGGKTRVHNLTVEFYDGYRIELNGGIFSVDLPDDYAALKPPALRPVGRADSQGRFEIEALATEDLRSGEISLTTLKRQRDLLSHIDLTVPDEMGHELEEWCRRNNLLSASAAKATNSARDTRER